jgi:hypothetical protein
MKPPKDGDTAEPVIYCVVDTMAVLKRQDGKTIKIEAQDNEFYSNLYQEKEDGSSSSNIYK